MNLFHLRQPVLIDNPLSNSQLHDKKPPSNVHTANLSFPFQLSAPKKKVPYIRLNIPTHSQNKTKQNKPKQILKIKIRAKQKKAPKNLHTLNLSLPFQLSCPQKIHKVPFYRDSVLVKAQTVAPG